MRGCTTGLGILFVAAVAVAVVADEPADDAPSIALRSGWGEEFHRRGNPLVIRWEARNVPPESEVRVYILEDGRQPERVGRSFDPAIGVTLWQVDREGPRHEISVMARLVSMETGEVLAEGIAEEPVRVDNVPPRVETIEVVGMEAGGRVGRNVGLRVRAGDTGGSGVELVQIWLTEDGGTKWQFQGILRDPEGGYTMTLPPGSYGVRARARDVAGNLEAEPREGDPPLATFNVVTDDPGIRLEFDPFDEHVVLPGRTLPVRWRVTDDDLPLRPATLMVMTGRQQGWEILSDDLPAEGSFDWTLPDGVYDCYRIRLSARDLAGNTADRQLPLLFSVDGAPPRPHGFDLPESWREEGPVRIPMRILDHGGAGTRSVWLWFRPADPATGTGIGRHWTSLLQVDPIGVIEADLDDGFYEVTVTAEDRFGNRIPDPTPETPGRGTILVDRAPPSFPVLVVDQPDGREMRIRWAAEDANLKPDSIMLRYRIVTEDERRTGARVEDWVWIAAGLPARGEFVWTPENPLRRYRLQVLAQDRAGREGTRELERDLVVWRGINRPPERREPEVRLLEPGMPIRPPHPGTNDPQVVPPRNPRDPEAPPSGIDWPTDRVPSAYESSAILSILDWPEPAAFRVGSRLEVAWKSNREEGWIRVALSADGGETWKVLASERPPTGRAVVRLPDEPVDALLKLIQETDLHVWESPAVPLVVRTAPRLVLGGLPTGYRRGGSILPIAWETDSPTGRVQAILSLDGGRTWGVLGEAEASAGRMRVRLPEEDAERALLRLLLVESDRIWETESSVVRIDKEAPDGEIRPSSR